MKNKKLNEVLFKLDTDEKKKNLPNYNIYLSKQDLNDIIFKLNNLVVDIKNKQNIDYLVSHIESIIFKLKTFDIPPEIQFQTIPTISTEMLDNEDTDLNLEKKESISPLEKQLQELGIVNQTICSNYEQRSQTNNKDIKQKYEGQVVNGKKEGKGKYIYDNGSIYEGDFKNDKREGNGVFYYANGDRYKGQFKDGFYQGNGIFYFNNGDKYEGGFDKNKYSGKGRYFYHNGDKFEGLWKNDKKNGEGVHMFLNGDKLTGNYKDGKPVGMHTKYTTDGKTIQINYSAK